MNEAILLEAKNLTKIYPTKASRHRLVVPAVDEVNIQIFRGETLGIVGESGCGKSTLGKMLVRLLEPSSGQIFWQGHDITRSKAQNLRQKMQIIFQDPYASLNPWMTLGDLVTEPAEIHHLITKAEKADYAKDLLAQVGLESYGLERYPHQFSGGQRQRIGIARALSVKPEFILCDEPVSALDVSIQSQILNLLLDLQEKFQLTYGFISHSFPVIRNLADRVAVMYLGRIVELAAADDFFGEPLHPYSQMLLSAVLLPDPQAKRRDMAIIGEAIGQTFREGCAFCKRCQKRQVICQEQKPILREVSPHHYVACHFYTDFA